MVAVDPGKQSSSIPAEAAAQNARYAERAAVALHAHTDLTQAGDRAPVAEAIIRLLTDLTHLADAYGVDFGHARDCAEDEHSDETFGG